jgi:hypothetical protein
MYAQKTTVAPEQTRMEIERLLSKHKASQYGTFVDHEARTARVQFRLHDRIVRFTVILPELPTYRHARPMATYDQNVRQRWRALLLVIKAKLEAVESHIATFEQEFLAHIVMPDGNTVGDLVLPQVAAAYAGRGGQLLLEGKVVDGTVEGH